MYAKGLAKSRSMASDLIKRGKVAINGKAITKPSFDVGENDKIEIVGGDVFVSRAGEKLDFALKAWGVDVSGLTVIDIGSSTGGFTDCLIKRGAAKVIAVDVGTDQLDESLRTDPRVEVHENTDIRTFSSEPVDMAVIDVSFISLEHVLEKAFELVKAKGSVIALVKPQFEVGKEIADRYKGIISDETIQKEALEKIKKLAIKTGFKIKNEAVSPLEGEKGNREFLILLQK